MCIRDRKYFGSNHDFLARIGGACGIYSTCDWKACIDLENIAAIAIFVSRFNFGGGILRIILRLRKLTNRPSTGNKFFKNSFHNCFGGNLLAVSYTHLDVYKRQVLLNKHESPFMRNNWPTREFGSS